MMAFLNEVTKPVCDLPVTLWGKVTVSRCAGVVQQGCDVMAFLDEVVKPAVDSLNGAIIGEWVGNPCQLHIGVPPPPPPSAHARTLTLTPPYFRARHAQFFSKLDELVVQHGVHKVEAPGE